PSWTVVSEEGPDQRTPNISSIIQEIVNRPGWSSGNSLVIIFEGTGERIAEAYNGEAGSAPLLEVVYGSSGGESGVGVGKIGQGLKFDGEDDEVSIPDDDTLDLSDEITLAMW